MWLPDIYLTIFSISLTLRAHLGAAEYSYSVVKREVW